MPDLNELQRLAEGATAGPWRTGLTDGWYVDGPGDHSSMHILAGRSSHPMAIVCASHALPARCDSLPANAAYIAAMSPDTAKKLIAVAQVGERAMQVLEEIAVDLVNNQLAEYRQMYRGGYKPHRIASAEAEVATVNNTIAALRTALEELKGKM